MGVNVSVLEEPLHQNKSFRVQKQEPLPPQAYTEVISRDYGRFLQHQNFANVPALKAEMKVAIDSLKNDSENYNNIYKGILSDGVPNDA